MRVLPFWPQATFAPDGTGAGGAGGTTPETAGAQEGAGENRAPDAGAAAAEAAAQANPAAAAPDGVPQRPDHIPEDLWDAARGELLTEKAVSELSRLRAEEAARAEARQGLPPEPAGYELRLPEELQLPDGIAFEFDDQDPLTAIGRDIAHAAGLDQAGFETKLLRPFIEMRVQEYQAEQQRQAEELRQLGERADDRIRQVNGFLDMTFNAEQADALRAVATTAAGVQAIEALMQKLAGPRLGGADPIAPKAPRHPAEVLYGRTA